MNAEEQLKLEKQIIDLPEDFWDLEAPPSTFRQIFDSIVYYGLVIAAVFQVICLLWGMLSLSGESSEQEDLLTGFEQWEKVLEAIQNR